MTTTQTCQRIVMEIPESLTQRGRDWEPQASLNSQCGELGSDQMVDGTLKGLLGEWPLFTTCHSPRRVLMYIYSLDLSIDAKEIQITKLIQEDPKHKFRLFVPSSHCPTQKMGGGATNREHTISKTWVKTLTTPHFVRNLTHKIWRWLCSLLQRWTDPSLVFPKALGTD